MSFVTNFYNNIDKNLVRNIRFRTDNIQSHQDVNIVLIQQHPRNMLRTLTKADFHSNNSIQVI